MLVFRAGPVINMMLVFRASPVISIILVFGAGPVTSIGLIFRAGPVHADFRASPVISIMLVFRAGPVINITLMRLLEVTKSTRHYNTSASCTQKAPTQSLSATHSVKPSEHRCWT